jgi:hypothetical protein
MKVSDPLTKKNSNLGLRERIRNELWDRKKRKYLG